jgi:hypothetical protein
MASKYVLMEQTGDSAENGGSANEFHYKGGLAMESYPGVENKTVPFSLAYGGIQRRRWVEESTEDIGVVPTKTFDTLFGNVAHEINEKGNRRTTRKQVNKN